MSYKEHMDFAKSLVAQLAPPSVSNEDV